jgi:nucleoside-diphosphate-sugar epimerase
MIDEPDSQTEPTWPSLPILDPQAEDDERALAAEDDAPRTILVTGAGGNIGRKLRAAWGDRYDLISLDQKVVADEPDLIPADLSVWSEDWTALFDEADAVVHLAANPDPNADWASLIGPNLDAVANVLLAAAQSGVERVVLISSCHVFDGPTWPFSPGGPWPVPPDTIPAATTPYGASKLAAERLAQSFAHATGMTVLALRIGWVLPGDNSPKQIDPATPHRSLWIATPDLVQLLTLAIEAELPEASFLTLFAASNNPDCPFSFDETTRILGYKPTEGLDD